MLGHAEADDEKRNGFTIIYIIKLVINWIRG